MKREPFYIDSNVFIYPVIYDERLLLKLGGLGSFFLKFHPVRLKPTLHVLLGMKWYGLSENFSVSIYPWN